MMSARRRFDASLKITHTDSMQGNRNHFTVIPHTADVGITAAGTTLPELFEHAAEGMFSFLGKPGRAGELQERNVEIRGFDNETLLVNWLNELLYVHAVEKILPVAFHVTGIEPGRLRARIKSIPRARDIAPAREIKAATYHQLAIRKTAGGFAATIIFDV